ncbi:MAG TPA: winged helix DNA-binding domain-containing protein, partial [Longimicrobium sp.]
REGAIVRTWPMRGTLHFVAAADVRWMLALTAPRAVARSAGRMRELEVDAPLISRAKRLFVGALEGGTQLTRGEMYSLLEDAGIATAGQRGYYLLWHAAHDGTICLAARRGKEHTYALLDEWVAAAPPLPRDEALAELAARYFTGHGPATVADFVWWSGMTVADAKRAIAGAGARLSGETIDRTEYWRSPDVAERDPSAAYLLPPFDEYLVGYRERGAVLDPAHGRRINAGGGLLAPVMVIGGTVVGVWKRTLGKNSVVIHAAPFDGGDANEFRGAAEEYGRFLGLPVELRTGS